MIKTLADGIKFNFKKFSDEDFLRSCDGLYPEVNAKIREKTNKTLSSWIRSRNKEIDTMFSHAILEHKCDPSDLVIVERIRGDGSCFLSIKHKNTTWKNNKKYPTDD